MHEDVARILFAEGQIRDRVEALAGELHRRFEGRELTLVAVLKGSLLFAADLIRRLPLRIRLGFAVARSYGRGTSPGALSIDLPDDEPVAGRTVLVVDEILDTGRTLRGVVAALRARGAAEVVTCVLLDKVGRREVEIEADHRGFVVEDEFVVGYGLDFDGEYRNLPYIGVLRPERTARPVSTESRTDGRG
jgi:hypoxanthine phosphoribosyltransferase